MPTQNEFLKDCLRGWKSDLTKEWRTLFGDVEPDLDALDDLKTADSHPLPKMAVSPSGAGDAAPRHLTRAFDNITPNEVRVVVIGEDPYPEKEKATGRAFEDGAWKRGEKFENIAISLKPLLLSAAAFVEPNLGSRLCGSEKERKTARVAINSKIDTCELMSPAAPLYFDALAEKGVLFVNAAWTFTRAQDDDEKVQTQKRYQSQHRKAWRRIMTHLLQNLTWRESQPIVFLLLGAEAKNLFQQSIGKCFKNKIIDESIRMATVSAAHPSRYSAKKYFGDNNPLARVNTALEALEADTIPWWPGPQDKPDAAAPATATPNVAP